jgi:hypothetical protein
MDIYFLFGYMGVGIFLMVRAKYLDEQLKRYIDKQYPEEGKFIRSHEWQGYPWAKWGRVMRALIKKQSAKDPDLAHRAKKAKLGIVHFFVWFGLFFLVFLVLAIYHLITSPK